jgi:hypothetical protein
MEKAVYVDDKRRCITYVVKDGKVEVLSDNPSPNLSTPIVAFDKALDDVQKGLYTALLDFLKRKAAEHLQGGGHSPKPA